MLLNQFSNTCASQPSGLIRVDRWIIKHSVNILPSRAPVKQKRRGREGDRRRASNEEVENIVKAGILREAIFPAWIANPVMVKKHGRS